MPRFYQQLTYDERCQISALKERSDRPTQIAKLLGRHRSSIIREVQRNREGHKLGLDKGDFVSPLR